VGDDETSKMVTFSHGGDVEKLRAHLESLGLSLGATEERLIRENSESLILWRENDVLMGHAIWHKSNTKQHPDGTPREPDDQRILEEELRVEGDFVELHEIWLSDTYRGIGYGSKFFEYLEHMVKERGYRAIVYYADHPAAMGICLKRGARAWSLMG
jgi:ribosomal protein S18 acetylase RimI-like enzyme